MRPYYADDLVTLYHGDCEKLTPALQWCSLLLIDPPYGVTQNPWDRAPDMTFLSRWIERAPVAVVFGQSLFSARVMLANESRFRYSLVWAKDRVTGFLNAAKMPLRAHEDIHVFYGEQPPFNPQTWQGEPLHGRGQVIGRKNNTYGAFSYDRDDSAGNTEKQPRSVIYCAAPFPAKYPCEKPVALMEWLIATYTNPGDLVLDLYAGSGTTLVAAKALGRRAIGVELTEEGCSLAASRLSQGVLDLGGAA